VKRTARGTGFLGGLFFKLYEKWEKSVDFQRITERYIPEGRIRREAESFL
jgi:hypothetical protein